MLDLHCHSTASDGSQTPTQIVALARQVGLRAVALTDHDTLDGLEEFLSAGKDSPVECIPGIELASQDSAFSFQSYHIVGLFLRRPSSQMHSLLDFCLKARRTRNLAILEKLAQHGIPITEQEVQALTPGEVIGRPHIAVALQKRGIVKTTQEAFERFLSSGKAAYVRRATPAPEEAIAAIHSMGGVAIWAHPFSMGNHSVRQIHQMALDLKAVGLDGIEVNYALHTATQIQNAREIARAVGLLPSGGSDFHGLNFRNIHLGTGAGTLQVPDSYLEPLRQCAEKK